MLANPTVKDTIWLRVYVSYYMCLKSFMYIIM